MKASKIILNIMSVVCFIYGALYIFSLVFIPIGIYCFIAGKRFSYKADHIDDVFAIDNKIFRNFVIFSSIFCFPLGLLSIIPFYLLTSNKIKVQTVNNASEQNPDNNDKTINETKTDDSNNDKKTTILETEQAEETLEEKKAKYEKLKKFNEKGLITDEELEQAYNQMFNKDNK